MTQDDRRGFLRLLGATTVAAAFPESIERALALPAIQRTGTIRDVEHIVILTQENRSFDHYFGSLRGVRGFGDPRAVKLPSGKSVWHQPSGNAEVLPFRPATPNLGFAFINDVPHGWNDGHRAFDNGNFDQWVPNKGTTAMTYFTREDIPYHYALADAFTICDAYFCPVTGPTDPNRYYLWTGWTGNDGKNGGPVLNNAEVGYDWRTFPELLQAAGISWKIYQDEGLGLDAAGVWGFTDDPYIGNFGDNSLLYFHQYQNAQPGSPLYERARRGTRTVTGGTLFDILRQDIVGGTLPQVSWIAAPEAYSEHPNWPPNYGAWYVSQILDALTSNPDVWGKTALFINFDENGGFFDHVVPPYPPPSAARGGATVDVSLEVFPGTAQFVAGPYGMCTRVPMIIVSPWTKGGFVCSQVFDHTSCIQFIERRFAHSHPGLFETQIQPWRRVVAGDLTSAFNFANPNARPANLPSTAGLAPPDRTRHPDFMPPVPANQVLPVQENGLRYTRALPYELSVDGDADAANKAFVMAFRSAGDVGACFHVRAGNTSAGPWSYTVEAGKSLVDTFDLAGNPNGDYDLSVYGPNGFFRSFKGGTGVNSANLDIGARYVRDDGARRFDDDGVGIALTILNKADACVVTVVNAHTGESVKRRLRHKGSTALVVALQRTFGWYDLAVTVDTDAGFQWHLAGHVENGRDSVSDPALGGAAV
jgi:phospholipase C